MRRFIKTLVLLLLGLVIINCSEDTVELIEIGSVTGKVVEANNFNPIENAKVSLSTNNYTVFTDENGEFSIEEVEVGDYSVSAEKEGFITSFEAATVTANLNVNVVFEMEDDNVLNKPPSKPELILPIDGAIDQDLVVQMKWSSIDSEDDELSFRLEIRNDDNDDIIFIEEIKDTIYEVSNLKYGRKYFWQVAVSDSVNEEVLSEFSSFKTKMNPENRFLFVGKNSNGNQVIYSSGFNETDEIAQNEVQLTSEDKNSWRPRKNNTSNLIAFLRNDNNETHLYTMDVDGGNIFQVTSSVPVTGYDLNEVDFSWSSNGNRLIYPYYDKLFEINKDGTGLKQIYQTSDGNFITECDWSQDESTIVLKTNNLYGYNTSIFTINSNGELLDVIIENINGAFGGLNLSVNNKLLLYSHDVSEYEDSSNRQLDTRLFIYNFETDESIEISSTKQEGFLDLDPRFSPNEAQVIFISTSNDGLSENHIMRVSINGSDDRTLLFSNKTMPDWE